MTPQRVGWKRYLARRISYEDLIWQEPGSRWRIWAGSWTCHGVGLDVLDRLCRFWYIERCWVFWKTDAVCVESSDEGTSWFMRRFSLDFCWRFDFWSDPIMLRLEIYFGTIYVVPGHLLSPCLNSALYVGHWWWSISQAWHGPLFSEVDRYLLRSTPMIAWNYGLGSTIPRAPPPAFVVLSRPVVLSLPSVPIPVSSLILAGFFFSCSLLCDMVLSHLLTYFSFLFLFWFGKGPLLIASCLILSPN